MRIRLLSFLALSLLLAAAAFGGEKRYVVFPMKTSAGYKGVPLWTDGTWADSCGRATINGTAKDRQTFCEDGFSGLKPTVGRLPEGIEVELLDSNQCGRMAYVRVLTGEFKGGVGCIVASALSSFKPE